MEHSRDISTTLPSPTHPMLGTPNHERHALFAKLIGEINQRLTSGLDDEEILDFIFHSLGLLIPYDRIGVALFDEADHTVRLKWVRSKIPIQYIKRSYTAPIDDSSLKNILESGQPRIINDLLAYSEEHPNSQNTKLILKDGIRSNLTCPLRAQGKFVGFVFFSSSEPYTYKAEHQEIFARLADELSVIIEHGRLSDLFSEAKSKEQSMRMLLHDLKSPLTVIQGFLEIITGQSWYLNLSSEGKEVFGILQRNTGYMVNLFKELSELLQIGTDRNSMRFQNVALKTFFAEIATYGKFLAEKKEMNFKEILGADLPTSCRFDPQQIRRALDNLFSNAIKFSARKTQITFKLVASNQGLVFSVEDQGQGIPENEVSKLFQEFGRTSIRPTEGEPSTGLGLAIVKKIVQEHGGQISVRTKIGEGSVFSFSIPCS